MQKARYLSALLAAVVDVAFSNLHSGVRTHLLSLSALSLYMHHWPQWLAIKWVMTNLHVRAECCSADASLVPLPLAMPPQASGQFT
ncbi:hypothetical protein CY34DRAFT_810094 [Suillus luteus UH-Slu-Lm8-n1]|uniref:Uncharacterized protein n=1 Tax=Suillus luteus UH-Slu-Lm8-n1 TaxID=930992 RepID=A0A0D0AHV1_9AGAM|nr:hypothetical protein CY34DRAFT_810094 [Suillus luteus UH-Slu-Lm8-n1]